MDFKVGDVVRLYPNGYNHRIEGIKEEDGEKWLTVRHLLEDGQESAITWVEHEEQVMNEASYQSLFDSASPFVSAAGRRLRPNPQGRGNCNSPYSEDHAFVYGDTRNWLFCCGYCGKEWDSTAELNRFARMHGNPERSESEWREVAAQGTP